MNATAPVVCKYGKGRRDKNPTGVYQHPSARSKMQNILFVKTSSLGDVIHQMPAVTEARRHYPDAHFSWAVEEAFAPLVALHPAVNEVIPVAWRRWRHHILSVSARREIRRMLRTLRARRYDAIVDTQGLARSAIIARLARGKRHGYDLESVRERFAAHLYDLHHAVPRSRHAVARNVALTSLALGYTPRGPLDYGLDRRAIAEAVVSPYAIALHASAQERKLWPEQSWIELGHALRARAPRLLFPWGTATERARSERIVALLPHGRVPDRRPLDAMARLIAGASFVVGVDTGILHLAAALGVPLVAIFTGSEPGLTGPVGNGKMEIVGQNGVVPSVGEVAAAIGRVTTP
jgi:heptosyltransferase I